MQLKTPRLLVACASLLSLQVYGQPAQTGKPQVTPETGIPSPLPARKAGLWEVTVRSDDLVLPRRGQMKPQPQTVHMCTDPKVEAVMLFAVVPAQEHCTTVTSRHLNVQPTNGWEIHTTCSVHGAQVKTQMQITGDLQTHYRGMYDVKFPNSPLYNTGRMLFEGRWLGACKPGQQPGDMLLPNGVTVNVPADKKHTEEEEH